MSASFLNASGVEGRIVSIQQGGKDVLSGFEHTKMFLSEDVSLKVNNTYAPLLGESASSSLLSLLSASFTNVVIPYQHALQTMSIWQSTEPLKFDLNVQIKMYNSGYYDVVKPVLSLMKLCSPKKNENTLFGLSGWLIPPGPDINTILYKSGIKKQVVGEKGSAETIEDSVANKMPILRGIYTINIGKYLTLPDVVLVNINPTFSKELDEDYYPVSCDLSIEAQTVEVATADMLESIIINLEKPTQVYSDPSGQNIINGGI